MYPPPPPNRFRRRSVYKVRGVLPMQLIPMGIELGELLTADSSLTPPGSSASAGIMQAGVAGHVRENGSRCRWGQGGGRGRAIVSSYSLAHGLSLPRSDSRIAHRPFYPSSSRTRLHGTGWAKAMLPDARELYQVGKFVEREQGVIAGEGGGTRCRHRTHRPRAVPNRRDVPRVSQRTAGASACRNHRQPILRAETPCGEEEGGGEGGEVWRIEYEFFRKNFPMNRASAGCPGDPAVAGVKVPGGQVVSSQRRRICISTNSKTI